MSVSGTEKPFRLGFALRHSAARSNFNLIDMKEERAGKSSTASPMTPEQIEIRELK